MIPVLAYPQWPNVERMFHNPGVVIDVVFQAELLVFFYLNYYFFVDRFYFTKKYVTYGVIIIVAIILFVPITDTIIFSLHSPPVTRGHGFRPENGPNHRPTLLMIFIDKKLYLFLFVFVASLLLKIRQHLKVIQQEKTTSELSLLKAQINPHFLFNTLNSIYSLSIQKSDSTPDAIVKLSNMMRYILKETNENFVPLKYELDYINDFVELQKLRLDKSVELTFNINGELSGQKIAPLVLIPYIENAFKYGVNAEEESTILIDINYSEKYLELKVKNTKVNTTIASLPSTKLGLVNAKKRLNLLYSNAHILQVSDMKNEFEVDLKLYLND